MIVIKSRNGIPVRLTQERWGHIIRGHPEMEGYRQEVVETLADPDIVQEGDYGEFLAIKLYGNTPFGEKYLVVIYKETDGPDGFVITSYFTRMPSRTRRVLWKR